MKVTFAFIELSNGEPINYYLSQDETNLKFTIIDAIMDNLNLRSEDLIKNIYERV